MERFHADMGVYPVRVMADQAYRNWENLEYCKERGTRMSRHDLGKMHKDKALFRRHLQDERMESARAARWSLPFAGWVNADTV